MVPAVKRALRKTVNASLAESTDILVARILISLGITNYKLLSECEALARAMMNADAGASARCIAAASVRGVCQRDQLKISGGRIASVAGVSEHEINIILQGENSPLKSIQMNFVQLSQIVAVSDDNSTPPRKQVRFPSQPTTSYIDI
eukprot:c6759_g1_i1.p1 GENE.c6759_g1_i1~~c6759_g1_i1.p1  ORF type:complete len:147 (+),score=32.67 c6759_g1_i1:816-1256(+)